MNALANFFLIGVHSKFAIILRRVYARLRYPVIQINILGHPKTKWVPSALNVGSNPLRMACIKVDSELKWVPFVILVP